MEVRGGKEWFVRGKRMGVREEFIMIGKLRVGEIACRAKMFISF